MPRASPKPCAHAGCGALVFDGSGWCDKHRKYRPGKFSDRHRASRQQRGYGAQWERVRKQVMQRDKGLCQVCMDTGRITAAVAVDHIQPKAEGGTDDLENLQAICAECHAAKTAAEGRRGVGQK